MSFTNSIRLLSIGAMGLSVVNLIHSSAAGNNLNIIINLGVIILSLSALPLLDYAERLDN